MEEMVGAVGLADSLDRYPWQLSGGMQQRVAIARALAYQPEVLMMDEPFASVDAQTRAELEDLLLRIWGEFGVTVLFVTHDVDESVYLGDRVAVLSKSPSRVSEEVVVDLPRPRDQLTTKGRPPVQRPAHQGAPLDPPGGASSRGTAGRTVRLATVRWGDGRRRALLIHGIQSNAAGWWRVGPALAEMGFAVTAPDLRGHGSSPDPADHTFDSHATDLIELGSGWDLVLGHSLGGALALVALRLDPGFATRLVLEDPALAIFDPDQALHQLGQPFGVEVNPEWVADHNPTWHPEDVRIKVEALERDIAPGHRGDRPAERAWNVLAELAALTIPTLVLGADPELGALVPPALGEGLRAV